jgi:ATP-dependent metalloprotease
MARHMVMQCGLNDELGPLYIEDEKLLSESLKQQVDAEVRGLLINARSQVKALLTEQLEQLHSVAAALLDHETLTAGQIKVRHVCLFHAMTHAWLLCSCDMAVVCCCAAAP